MEYIFILGQAHELCQAELENILKRELITYQPLFTSDRIFHLKVDKELNFYRLMNILGGTVKIAKVFGDLKRPLKESEFLKRVIPEIAKEKKDFGLSCYGGNSCIKDLIRYQKIIKEVLAAEGFRVNYVLPSKGLALSSVVVTKRKLTEINIIGEKEKFFLAKTLIVQDFFTWNKRDYGRPCVDPKKGMLPPKVARMMVNLRGIELGSRNEDFILFDPFCGMGTVLAEAMMVGCSVIGSDIDKESVEKTKKNLEWLVKSFNIKHLTFKIFISDATHVSERLKPESIDAIVTESYLGPLIEIGPTSSANWRTSLGARNLELRTKNKKKITPEYLKNIITGLEKLYIGCLKDWWKILKVGGRVVIVIPSYKISKNPPFVPTQSGLRRAKQRFFVKKPLDICEKLGYNLVSGPYKYCRPQAVVERNIYILQKLSSFRNSKS